MTGAKEYGKALFSLTEELGISEEALGDLRDAVAALKENPGYITLLDTPALPSGEKVALSDEAFASLLPTVRDLIAILCEKHAVYLLPAVAQAFREEYDEARGILRAEAITARPMTDAQRKSMSEKLARMTGKKVVLQNRIDPKIIGGVTLRYAGIQLDDSLRSRLDRLAESLQNAIL